MHFIFGPVASSRLGRSLGLDLLGHPICTLDCLYCEVGPTRKLTTTRAPYVPAAVLLEELDRWRATHPDLPLDHVTLGGAGEPCLNTALPEIIAGARARFPETPIAVLTNATLMTDPVVREELAAADVVLPSMDSLRVEAYRAVNRPHPALMPDQAALDALAEALRRFRERFAGRLYLEMLLCRGVNDTAEDLARCAEYVARLAPHRVDVTTLSRPGAYAEAEAVPRETLTLWRETLSPLCAADEGLGACVPRRLEEAGPRLATAGVDAEALRMEVLTSLQRRPQTAAQLSQALGASAADLVQLLDILTQIGHIHPQRDVHGETFYRIVPGADA